jgi:serine/threonine protein kinase
VTPRPTSESVPSVAGLKYLQELGSGGYSDVYLFEQEMPQRKVAVKVLRRGDLGDNLRRQFVAEANAMAALSDHPNIVPVYSTGETDDGRPYLLMSYYSRPNLGVRAAADRLSVAEVLRIGIQVSSAVETAHRAGILHRDIKPANILTSQYGTPGLTDFGIAAQLAAAETPDEDTGVSVPWAPPEVLYATAPGTVRSDVYSLGATLWHLLVGRSPFEVPGGDNKPYALMVRIRDASRPSTGRADVPTSFERLLQQSLSIEPGARPATALVLARALQGIEQEMRLPRTEIVVLTDEQTNGVRRAVEGSAAATFLRSPTRVPSPTVSPISAPPIRRAPPPAARNPPPVAPAPTLSKTPASPAPRRAPLPETIHRPTVAGSPVPPPETTEAVPHAGQKRLLIGAGLVLVVLAIGIGVVLASTGGSPPKHSAQQAIQTQDPLNAGEELAPGPVSITTSRPSSQTVKFTWTYANPMSSDSFRWRTTDSAHKGTVTVPTVTVADSVGTSICLQVQVFRADGTNPTDWSSQKCAS